MTTSAQPLVSVVTPVYNGQKYLAECIESVLAQSYANWEYIIVNNCSKDDTFAIASEYAHRDARIRVVTNQEVLPMIQNWNHALRQISAESQFCKVVHADDWLFPECIERMVEVALRNPAIGLVSAYRLNGNEIDLDGLPYPSVVMSGLEIGRLSLGENPLYLFGSPTSTLIRSDLIRARRDFYDTSLLHADTDACLRLLQENDFGFVYQVLTYTRWHKESVTSRVQRLGTIQAERIHQMKRYGPIFLDKQEYQERLEAVTQSYYRMLASNLFNGAGKEFWEYHTKNLSSLSLPFQRHRMIRPLLMDAVDALIHFKRTVRGVWSSLRLSTREKQRVQSEW